MSRIINLRVMLVASVGVTLTVLISYAICIRVVLGIVFAIIFVIVFAVGFVLAKRFGSVKWCVTLVITLVLSVATCCSFWIRSGTYHSVEPVAEEIYSVEGRIDELVCDDHTVRSITVSDAKVNGKKIRGNVSVILSEEIAKDEFVRGYSLSVSGKLYKINLVSGRKVDGSSYRKNLRYKLYTDSDCTVTPAKAKALMKLRLAIRNKLTASCGETYGSIAYCMITGDKSELDSSAYRLYGMSGIGHVLAVSGMHVGIICAVITFVLGKLRVNKAIRVSLTCGALVLYAVFVGLGASVVRAVITCIIGLLTLLCNERKDPLNSLCLAYSLILVAEPFLMFETGFLMSFGAVFGLVLFSAPFSSALRKIRIPKFIAAPLAATAAVHLGILPVTAYFFGATQTYSMLFNLLVVPIVTVTFVAFLIVLPFSFVFHTTILLRVCGVGFAVTDIIAGAVAYLPFGSIPIASHESLFLLFPAYFAASRFVMIPKGKRTVTAVIAVSCAALVLVPTLATLNIPKEIRSSLIPVNSYGDVTSVIVDEKVTVLGDVKDTVALKRTLKSHGIRKVDTVIVNRLTEKVGRGLSEFLLDYSVDKVICTAEGTDSDGIAALGDYRNFYLYEYSEQNNILPITVGDRAVGFVYEFSSGEKIISVGYSSRYTAIPYEIIDSAPIIRCFAYLNDMPDRIYLTNMPKGYFGEVPFRQFTLADSEGFVYKIATGEIIKNR